MFKPILFPTIPSPSIADQQINDSAQQAACTETQPGKQESHTQHNCAPPCEEAGASKQTNMASTISAPLVQQTSLQRALQDKEKNNYQTITGQHIQQWRDLSDIERAQITRDNFARQHLLSPVEFKNYVTVNGRLKLRGRVLLNSGQSQPFRDIECKDIQAWQALSQKERDHITRDGFAKKYQLDQQTFGNYVTVDGRLKLRGKSFFNRKKSLPYRKIACRDIQTWQAMSQEERDHLTREGFAEQHQLSPQSFANYVTTAGQLNARGQILLNKQKGFQYQRVSWTDVQAWQDMSPAQREQMTFNKFALQHSLNPLNFQNYISANGQLRARGQALFNKRQGIQYQNINRTHIQAWQDMSPEQREQMMLEGFADAHQINPQDLLNYVTVAGQLNARGRALLNKQKNIQYQKISWTHVQAWQELSQAQREQITFNNFALQHSLNPLNFQNYISANGQLKDRGQALFGKRINWIHVQAWQDMSQVQRAQITRDGFAIQHQLNPEAFRKYVKVNGQIKPRGQALANKQQGVSYQKVRWEDIQSWQNMLPNERKLMTLGKFAEQRQLSFNTLSLYVRANGAFTQKAKSLFKEKIDVLGQQATSVSITTAATAEEDTGDLKLFPAPGYPVEVQAITHQINNNAPILQHHLTGETLTGEANTLHASSTSWMALRPFLSAHSQSEQRQIKRSIMEQVKEWVRTEGHHQQRFNEMLEVAMNIDDTTPRGTSVFAKQAIPAFTVIGPYSGILLPDHEALEQLAKQYGHNNIQTYLYQAGPATGPYRDRAISAFRSGNVLSLINDAELSEPILDHNGQVIKNNIAPIRIDNKIFLVSVTDILPEQELFLDYGEAYQAHFKRQLAMHQQVTSIKQEES